MAGAGYKLFSTGDVLSASDVNLYLQQQTVMVFASAAARTTALASVLAEGMITYLKDTDALEIYSGTAWVGYGSGDITGITTGATSGLAGGVTSGTASLSLATVAKGDLLAGTGSNTAQVLTVGADNTVLTADSSTATGLKWATPAGGGGKVLQVVQDTLETNYSTASGTYNDTGLTVTITPSATTSKIMIISYARVSITSTGTKTANYGALRLVVGATPTVLQEQSIGMGTMASVSAPEFYINVNFSLLHSPATTSATTYKIQGKTSDNSNTAITGSATSINSIVAMEIGA